jgi:HlyD family secretion protein
MKLPSLTHWKRWLIYSIPPLLLLIFWLSSGDNIDASNTPTFTAKRGPMRVTVLQGGEVRALENHEIRCDIELPTKILSLVPEGYRVTPEDIQNGKVLVELDASELKDKILTSEVAYQTAMADYIESDEAREIQRSENQSLLRDSKQSCLYALMDFEKYLGRTVAASILLESELPSNQEKLEAYISTFEAQSQQAHPADGTQASSSAPASIIDREPKSIDFTPYLKIQIGGDGEAQQQLRQLADDVLLRQSEQAVAQQKSDASTRLASRGFVPKTQKDNDLVSLEKANLAVKTAQTQQSLFRTYGFVKQCSQILANYRENLTKMERTIRGNRSKMAQVETKFQTSKKRFEVEKSKRADLERQLSACVIKATKTGLVAYGALNGQNNGNKADAGIEEGASVRFRQTILTIPDMSQMGVLVKIHESHIKKIRIGQSTTIRLDAEPSKILNGKVAELALLPDSSSSRYSPNLKVYPTQIHIEGVYNWLKPGMNAKVEIIVTEIPDTLQVPVQAIEVGNSDQHYCYLKNGSSLERRAVETGAFNDEFIEIKNGLKVGDSVAISLPKKAAEEDTPSTKPSGKPKKPKKEKDMAASRAP